MRSLGAGSSGAAPGPSSRSRAPRLWLMPWSSPFFLFASLVLICIGLMLPGIGLMLLCLIALMVSVSIAGCGITAALKKGASASGGGNDSTARAMRKYVLSAFVVLFGQLSTPLTPPPAHEFRMTKMLYLCQFSFVIMLGVGSLTIRAEKLLNIVG
jgi:hypothetical protein